MPAIRPNSASERQARLNRALARDPLPYTSVSTRRLETQLLAIESQIADTRSSLKTAAERRRLRPKARKLEADRQRVTALLERSRKIDRELAYDRARNRAR